MVLVFELGACTLSHSTSHFFCGGFFQKVPFSLQLCWQLSSIIFLTAAILVSEVVSHPEFDLYFLGD
jgi:hypothetical protein